MSGLSVRANDANAAGVTFHVSFDMLNNIAPHQLKFSPSELLRQSELSRSRFRFPSAALDHWCHADLATIYAFPVGIHEIRDMDSLQAAEQEWGWGVLNYETVNRAKPLMIEILRFNRVRFRTKTQRGCVSL